MTKFKQCTPLANNASFNLFNAVSDILERKTLPEQSAQLIFSAIMETEPDFFADFNLQDMDYFNQYVSDVVNMVDKIIPDLAKTMGVKRSEYAAMLGDTLEDTIVKISNEYGKNQIALNETKSTQEPDTKNQSVRVDGIDENPSTDTEFPVASDNFQDEMEELGSSELPSTEKNNTTSLADIMIKHFAGITEMKSEFEKYFTDSFFSHLIDQSESAEADKRFNGDFPSVFTSMMGEFQAEAQNNPITSENPTHGDLREFPSMEEEVKRGYYAYLSVKYFHSLAKELISKGKGIDLDRNTFNFDADNRTSYSSYEGAHDAFNQMPYFSKMVLLSTPKLSVEVDPISNRFKLSRNTKYPFLTQHGIKNTLDKIGSFSQKGSKKFAEDMLNEIKNNPNDVMASLYFRFFSPTPYTVDGESFVSLNSITGDGSYPSIKMLLTSIENFLKSSHTCENVKAVSNKITFTKSDNSGLAANIVNDIDFAIQDPRNPKYAKDHLLSDETISLAFNHTNNLVMTIRNNGAVVANITLKNKPLGTKGTLVEVEEGNLNNEKLNSEVAASRVLSALLGPVKATEIDFLKQYRKVAGTASAQDIRLPNLVANIAFGIAINNKGNHSMLETNAMLPTVASDQPESLSYPLFDYLYEFENGLKKAADHFSLEVKATRRDQSGNVLALTTNVSKFHSAANFIKEVAEVGPESVLFKNSMVKGPNGSRVYDIGGYFEVSDVEYFGQVKAYGSLDQLERTKYAMEYVFLQSAAQTNFKSIAIKPLIPSDKTKIEAVQFNILNNKEFLPVQPNSHSLDVKSLENELISTRKVYHVSLAETILKDWNKALAQKGLPNFKTIQELDSYLKASNITYDTMRDTDLVEELMFEKRDGKMILKQSFMTMLKTWSNDESARSYIKRMKSKYRLSLAKMKFLSADTDLEDETLKVMRARFGHKASSQQLKRILADSYFYHFMTLSHEFGNIAAGSIYQFKTDIKKHKETLDNNQREHLRILKEQNPAIIDEELATAMSKFVEEDTMDLEMTGMWTNQIKRNAPLTSTITRPKLVAEDEEGLMLDINSYSAVVEDQPEGEEGKTTLKLLGKLMPGVEQEPYDAVCFALPFYFQKMNKSLGGKYGVFFNSGAPMKDLTISHDARTGNQKIQKKSTFLISFELLQNGSPELHNVFIKMLSSIPVEVNIDGKVYHNMYEVWSKHFNGWSNPDAFESMGEWLGKNPSFRNKYIETVVFKSAEKTGSQRVNTTKVLTDSSVPMLYSLNNNLNHGVILNQENNPDTTGKFRSLDEEDSLVSLPTQFVAAAMLEGNSALDAMAVNNALKALSKTNLDIIKSSVFDLTLKLVRNTISSKDFNDLKTFEALDMALNTIGKVESREAIMQFAKERELDVLAQKEFAREIAKRAIASREVSGMATTLINKGDVVYESLQLKGVLQSAMNSYVNENTVRIKFKGGQYVVAPAHDFLKMYQIKGGRKVTRAEKNKICFSNKDTVTLDGSNISFYTSADLVSIAGGKPLTLGEARNMASFNDLLKGGSIAAANLGESAHLSWMSYYNVKTGQRIEDLQEYNDLYNEKNEDKRKELEIKLQQAIANPDWVARDSEFLMPQIHGAVYNLTERDSLFDIVGDFDRSTKEGYQQALDKARKFFSRKLTVLSGKDRTKLQEMAKNDNQQARLFLQLRPITAKTFEEITTEILSLEKTIKSLIPGSTHKPILVGNLNRLKSIRENSEPHEIISILEPINDERKSERERLAALIAYKQASNFIKTLEFIVGRIPAQGKQSFTAGVIAGFINSTKNSIYGPAEMLKITGADHDGDKGNVIAYSVDPFGEIYSYDKYVDETGNISNDKLNEIIEKIKLDNHSHPQLISKLIREEQFRAKEATKNFVLDKLLSIARAPINAIESSTPVEMTNVQKAITKGGQVEVLIGEDDSEGGVIASGTGLLSPDNPGSHSEMEIILSDGKEGVGIFATAIKVYSAVTAAVIKDPKSPLINFKSSNYDSLPELVYSSKEMNAAFKEQFGLTDSDQEAFKMFLVDDFGEVTMKKSAHIANTLKFDLELTDQAKRRVEALKEGFQAEGLTEEQVAERLSNDASKILLDEAYTTEQAWEYISELLSAATDNAKEFILGRIGANDLTSGIIATQLMLGFKLRDVLELFKNQEVQEVIASVKESKNLYIGEFPTSLRKELQRRIKVNFHNTYVQSQIQRDQESLNNLTKKLEKLRADTKTAKELTDNPLVVPVSKVSCNVFSRTSFQTTLPLEAINKYDGTKYGPNQEMAVIYEDFRKKLHKPEVTNLTELLAQMRVIKDSDLIISDKYTGAEGFEILQEYAKSLGKKMLNVNDKDGSLREREDSFLTMNLRTGVIKTQDHDGVNVVLDQLASHTSMLFETPDKFDALAKENLAKLEDTVKRSGNVVAGVLNSVVSNGVRQLLPFVQASAESRVLSAILSINQGLPNSSWDTFNYFQSIASQISGINEEFQVSAQDILEFFESLVKGDGRKAEEMIAKYDKFKSAFNPFYILKQNDHYLGYIESLMQSKQWIENINRINRIQNNLSGSKSVKTEDQYRELEQFLYAYSVDKFYNSTPGAAKIMVQGTPYDLSDPNGRFEFTQDMINVVTRYKEDPRLTNNAFMKALFVDTDFRIRNQSRFTLLRTHDISLMNPSDKATLQVALNELANHPDENITPEDRAAFAELYNALYHYTLILYKGGRGKNSFASLFDPDYAPNQTYLSSLKDIKLEGDFDNLQLFVPSLAPVLSTKPKRIFTDLDIEVYRRAGSQRNSFYRMPPIDSYPAGSVFKSRELGKYFVNNGDMWLVITPAKPTQVINYNFKTGITDLERAGWQLGETAFINEEKEEGQVLYYDPIKDRYQVKTSNSYRMMTAEELSQFNSDNGMIFSRYNFGKKTEFEIANKETEEDSSLDIKFRIKPVIENGIRYMLLGDDIDFKGKEGDMISEKTYPYKGSSVKIRINFLKRTFNDNSVFAKQLMKRMHPDQASKFMKSTSTDPYVVAEVKVLNRPNVVREQYIDGNVIGQRQDKILNGTATAFFTSKELKGMIKGDTQLIKMSYGSNAFYMAKKDGTLKEAFDKHGTEKLGAMLGYTGTPDMIRNNVNRYVREHGNSDFFTVTPYNAKNNFVNSLAEFDFIGPQNTPLLQNLTVNMVHESSKNFKVNGVLLDKRLKDLGVTNINTHESNMPVDSMEDIKQQLLEDKVRLFRTEGEIPGLNNMLSAISAADVVLVFGDLEKTSLADARKAGFSREPNRTAEVAEFISLMIKQEPEIESEFKNQRDRALYLRDILETDGSSNTVLRELFSKLKKAGNNSDHKRLLDSVISYLTDAADANIPERFKVHSKEMFAQVHASKLAGKELYVFDKLRQQWIKFKNDGSTEDVKIPILVGKVAMFGHARQMDALPRAVTTVFENSNKFQEVSHADLGRINVTSELSIPSMEPTAEINQVKAEGEAAFDNSDVERYDITTFDTVPNPEDPTNGLPAIRIDGETIFLRDSKDFSKAKISQFGDGSILIEDAGDTFVVFPDESLRQSYANFGEGSEVDGFNFTVGNNFYRAGRAYRVDNINSFELRDQLINEKQAINESLSKLQAIRDFQLAPMYRSLRFSSLETARKFEHIDVFSQFMGQLRAGMLDEKLSSKEKELAKQLIDLDKQYREGMDKLMEEIRKIRQTNGATDSNVQLTDENFDDMDDAVLVTLIDTDFKYKDNLILTSKKKATFVRKRSKNTKFHYGKDEDPSTLQAITLPAFEVENGEYTVAHGLLVKQLRDLESKARELPNKTFIVEFPFDSLSTKVMGNVTGNDMARAWSRAITRSKMKSWPANIKFSTKLGTLVNMTDGITDLSRINRVKNYTTTSDINNPNAYNVSRLNLYTNLSGSETMGDAWNRWRGLSLDNRGLFDAPTSFSFVTKEFNGNMKDAYKSLWRLWADTHPKEFMRLAADINGRDLYDPAHSEANEFSTGSTLAELLTEKFVDNSWLTLPVNENLSGTKLGSNQTWLPISSEEMKKMQFSSARQGGKSIVTIGGEKFVATIENPSHSTYSVREPFSNELLARVDSDIADFLNKYPFMSREKFAFISLSPLSRPIPTSKRLNSGDIISAVKKSGIKLTNEQEILATEATTLLPIDHMSNLADSASDSIFGTGWIMDIKKATNDNVFLDYTSDDKIWVFGSTMADVHKPEDVKSAFESVVHIINKAMEAKATILVGSNTGMDEQVKSYVLATNKDYNLVGNELKHGPVSQDPGALKVYHNSNQYVGRFNSNNDYQRGQNFSGMTVMSTKADEEFLLPYTVSAKSVVDFNSPAANADSVLHAWLGDPSSDTEFTRMRGQLLSEQQVFMRRLAALRAMVETGNLPTAIYGVDAFDEYTNRLMGSVPFAESLAQWNSVLFDGEGKSSRLSDAALMVMIRNLHLSNLYMSEKFPDVMVKEVIDSPLFDMLQSDRARFEGSKEYFAMLREGKIASSDLSIFLEGEPSVKDLFHFMSSTGPGVSIRDGKLEGQLAAKEISTRMGLDAVTDGDKLLVFNNDLITGIKRGALAFDSKHTVRKSKFASDEERMLGEKFPKDYQYAKRNGLVSVDPFTGTIKLFINDDIKEYDQESILKDPNAFKRDLHNEIIKMYHKYLPYPSEQIDFHSSRFLASNHIRRRRHPFRNPWVSIFSENSEAVNDRPLSQLSAGQLYEMDGHRFVMIVVNGQRMAVNDKFKLLQVDLLSNQLLETVDKLKESDPEEMVKIGAAMPSQVGQKFSSVLYMDSDENKIFSMSDVENGFEVEEQDGKKVINSSQGNFVWSDKFKIWLRASSLDVAHIKQVGGFKNKNYRFQKSAVQAGELASRSVSPAVLGTLASSLSDLGVSVRLMSSQDLSNKFGKVISEMSSFTYGGTVYLNSDRATMDSPFHEYSGHIFMSYLKAQNPAAYALVVQKCLQHPIKDVIANKYKENSEIELGEEIFSTLAGLDAQGLLNQKQKSAWIQIKEMAEESESIFDFLRKLFNLVFGKDAGLDDINYSSTLKDIIRQVNKATLYGEKSQLRDWNKYMRDKLDLAVTEQKSDAELIKMLEEKGLIQIICI
jgi:hypothetical protein